MVAQNASWIRSDCIHGATKPWSRTPSMNAVIEHVTEHQNASDDLEHWNANERAHETARAAAADTAAVVNARVAKSGCSQKKVSSVFIYGRARAGPTKIQHFAREVYRTHNNKSECMDVAYKVAHRWCGCSTMDAPRSLASRNTFQSRRRAIIEYVVRFQLLAAALDSMIRAASGPSTQHLFQPERFLR